MGCTLVGHVPMRRISMGCTLVGHILVGHILVRCIPMGCTLAGCILMRCMLVGCTLVGLIPMGCIPVGCILVGRILMRCIPLGCILAGWILPGFIPLYVRLWQTGGDVVLQDFSFQPPKAAAGRKPRSETPRPVCPPGALRERRARGYHQLELSPSLASNRAQARTSLSAPF